MPLDVSHLMAFGIGFTHALEPGHGKNIMGAYLVLARGRAVDALCLGLVAAATHTVVVLTLAFGARWAVAGLPQREFSAWVQVLSGVLVAATGLRLIFYRSSSCDKCGWSGWLADTRQDRLGLFLVGISNALSPCPGALAVMLMSLASNTPFEGLSLVLAFGAGGAVALVGVGLLFVYLASLAKEILHHRNFSRLRTVGGLLVFLSGILTAWRAFS